MSFNSLKKYDVLAQPREYQLNQIEGEVRLQLLPATEANRPYHAALLKRNARRTRQLQAGRVDPAMIAQNRNEDRELYASHVVRGWSGVKDDAGAVVPFSIPACLEFLQALPNWIFDELRNFASVATNFVAETEPTPDEVEEHGGN